MLDRPILHGKASITLMLAQFISTNHLNISTIIHWKLHFPSFLNILYCFKLIYCCMTEQVLGRLPCRPLENWLTLILMVASLFISLLFIENRIFHHYWTFCVVLKLIYSHMAEPVIGRSPGRPLPHCLTLISMLVDPIISLLFIENHIFHCFRTFYYIVLKLIYYYMAEQVLGQLPSRPL